MTTTFNRPRATAWPRLAAIVALTLGGAWSTAAAQTAAPAADGYPSRTVRLVVPYAPGGALDTVARALAPRLAERLGQAVIVENKPGAATIIGNDTVAKAAPDGHTLLFAAAPIALNTALGVRTPYDVQRDFAPISLVASGGALVLVHPSTPYRTLQDIVQAARTTPGGLTYATAGSGSMPHLIGEGLKVASGANLVHVGYKGSTPALQDAMSGAITVLIDGYVPSGAQAQAGKLRAIAYAAPKRSPLLPDVPTTAEQGYPDLVGGGFFGLLAPAGTPRPIVERVHAAVRDALAQPDLRESLVKQGYEVHGSTPAEYAEYIRRQVERWTPVAKAAGIKPE